MSRCCTIGKDSRWWGLWAAKMYQTGSNISRRREEAPDFWSQQIRREKGVQVPKVLGFHVESSIMGYGVCSYHGHCIGQWRGNSNSLEFIVSCYHTLVKKLCMHVGYSIWNINNYIFTIFFFYFFNYDISIINKLCHSKTKLWCKSLRTLVISHSEQLYKTVFKVCPLYMAGQATGLARFHWYCSVAYRQLNHQFRWGKQCWQCCSCFDGWSCTQNQGNNTFVHSLQFSMLMGLL